MRLGALAAAPRDLHDGYVGSDVEEGFDLLLFRIRDALFGVSLDQIREILEVDDYARLTVDDASLRGATFHGRSWIPMVDVARRLGIEWAGRYAAPVLLITEVGGHDIGFLLDDPEDVVTVSPDVFRPLPELILRTRSRQAVYAAGLLKGGRLLLLLDVAALMSAEEAALAARVCAELPGVES